MDFSNENRVRNAGNKNTGERDSLAERNPYEGKDVSEKKSLTGKSSSAFRTISEVADELGLQQHVLRFWETKFSQIRPLKRGGGRRYYRPEDVSILKVIHHLLHTNGYTIKGVQKLLRETGKKKLLEQFENGLLSAADLVANASQGGSTMEISVPVAEAQDKKEIIKKAGLTHKQKNDLHTVLDELKQIRDVLNNN